MKHFHKISKSIVAIGMAAMLFSCQGKLNEVRQWEIPSTAPQAVGKEINLFYTDSGTVKAHLKSPLMYDFSNQTFPYREFPDGLHLDFFGDAQEKSTVESDYAIIYETTGLVDLRGNVEIVMADSTILHAKQLYWDKDRQWVFTDLPYDVKLSGGGFNKGEGFDSNQKFDNFSSRSNVGMQVVKEQTPEETEQEQ